MFFFRFFSHSYFIHIVISCTFYLHNRRRRANSIENAPLLLLGLLSCAAGLDQPDWPPKRWRVMFISGTRFYLRLHPNGRTSLRRLVPVRLENPLAVAPCGTLSRSLPVVVSLPRSHRRGTVVLPPTRTLAICTHNFSGIPIQISSDVTRHSNWRRCLLCGK